jgi:hypothetical protein
VILQETAGGIRKNNGCHAGIHIGKGLNSDETTRQDSQHDRPRGGTADV